MNMKRNIYLLSIILLLSTSCTGWLDVTPKDTIVEEDLFEEATGFRNALNGIYKQMSCLEMYGQEMSWGFVDILGQCYSPGDGSVGTDHSYYRIMRNYDYETDASKSFIQNIWSKTYNSIANCNNIIEKIKNYSPSRFLGGEIEKNLILGEAYALRAILHLDMLRLFAPAPIKNSKDKHIPYIDTYPTIVAEYKSTDEVFNKIIDDLKTAYNLVVTFDDSDLTHRRWLTTTFRFSATNNAGSSAMPTDIFYAFRGYRLNCYAISAMLARTYNYFGKHDLAAAEAQKVIDAKYLDEPLFSFATDASTVSNKKMSDDLIFTLSNSKLYSEFLPYSLGSGDSGTASLNFELEYELGDDYLSLFDDGEDYRLTKLCHSTDDWLYYSSRNVKPSMYNKDSQMVEDMLPMIRLSEMYYILAEAQAANNNFSEAMVILDEVRGGRNCTKGRLSISDYDSFKLELLKEVKREFIGEGQMFFYFKKFDHEFFTSRTTPDWAFTLPLPNNQTIN